MTLASSMLGLRIAHPFVAGASPLGRDLDTIRRLEDGGAAAIVLPSLFEEQVTFAVEGRIRHMDPLRQAVVRLPEAFPAPERLRVLARRVCRARGSRETCRRNPDHRIAQRHDRRSVADVLAPHRTGRRQRPRAQHVRGRDRPAHQQRRHRTPARQCRVRAQAIRENPHRREIVPVLRVARAISPASSTRPAPTVS